MFVFLGPELCRQLPSDSTSRWTLLLLVNGWKLQPLLTDSHRQVIRPARRTQMLRIENLKQQVLQTYLIRQFVNVNSKIIKFPGFSYSWFSVWQ